MNRICMEERRRVPEFGRGRHTRFMYNSDDENEGEEEGGMARPKAREAQSILE